ncbi:hypothetical protein P4114_01030 [Pseudomonas aeruginosa]|nr:hypothetical protein [Pseudomonas aeruginosa]
MRAWLVLLCAVPLLLRAAEAPVQLAWRTTQGYELVSLDRQRVLERRPLPADLQAPLGSLWETVRLRLAERHRPGRAALCLPGAQP